MKTKFLLKGTLFSTVLFFALVAFNSCGEDEGPEPININASFTANNTAGTGIVSFTNTTTVTPESATGLLTYSWDFGDSDFPDTNTSTEISPTHTYLKVGDYTVTLVVKVAGTEETATVTETINISEVAPDVTSPTLTLNGDPQIALEVGQEFVDPGVVAIDDIDGDVSGNVTITVTAGENNVSVEGVNVYSPTTYTITYTATDLTGNVSSLIRLVTVAGNPDNILQSTGGVANNGNWTMDLSSITDDGNMLGWPNTPYLDADIDPNGTTNNYFYVVEIEDEFGKNGVLKAVSQALASREETRTTTTFPAWWGGLAYRATTDYANEVNVGESGLSWAPNKTYEFSFDLWTETEGASDVYIGFEWVAEWNNREGSEKSVTPTTTKQRFTVEVNSPNVTEDEIVGGGTSRRFAGPSFIFHHLGDSPATYYIDNLVMVEKE